MENGHVWDDAVHRGDDSNDSVVTVSRGPAVRLVDVVLEAWVCVDHTRF